MDDEYAPAPPMTREEVMREFEAQGRAWLERAEEIGANYQDEPDDTVSFAFELVRAARAFEHHLTLAADDLTMTALQARFAWLLATTPFGIPMTTLWVELGMSQPGARQMVKRMADRGLVEVEQSSWDYRNSVVSLTPLGRQQWDAAKQRVAAVCEELTEAVGPKKSTQFRAHVISIEELDERFPLFRALRNPLGMLT
ncbi:MarR family winged helix-turn-helix transcriptional regulator [Demequina sp.]|uniref:MarR family winged helix-turn-helix transcriptional regulator n=1 Tax=Demequina sp. TaxID=2050685 RepID=UPI003D0FB68D